MPTTSLRYHFEQRSPWITAPLVLSLAPLRGGIEPGTLGHLGPGWEGVGSLFEARARLAKEIVARVPGVIAEGRTASLAISIREMADASARLAAAVALEEVLVAYGSGELTRVFDWGLEPARSLARQRHPDDRYAVAGELRPLALDLMRPYLDGRRKTRTPVTLLAFLHGVAGVHAQEAARAQHFRQGATRSYLVRSHEADAAERELAELARAGWISDLVRQPVNRHGSVEFTYLAGEDYARFKAAELLAI